jgi:hypothetical protein
VGLPVCDKTHITPGFGPVSLAQKLTGGASSSSARILCAGSVLTTTALNTSVKGPTGMPENGSTDSSGPGQRGEIVPLPAAKPAERTDCFAVATKARGRPVRLASRHASIRGAREGLATLLRGLPRNLDWAAIFDTTKGAPSDPRSIALVLCVFNRERIAS